jgi:hypothetical protein
MTWETLPNRTGLCEYMYPQKPDATNLGLKFVWTLWPDIERSFDPFDRDPPQRTLMAITFCPMET